MIDFSLNNSLITVEDSTIAGRTGRGYFRKKTQKVRFLCELPIWYRLGI